MEKLLYPLWKAEGLGADAFRDALLAWSRGLLAHASLPGLRLAVVDSAVAPAAGRRLSSGAALPDALLSVWLRDTGARAPLEAALVDQVARFACYRVREAEPLVYRASAPDGRVPGMCQVAFLHRPARLSEEAWLSLWQGSHTRVAIETQGTFGYRQNVVEQSLDGGGAPPDAVVEENFPPEAMTSEYAFYGVAPGDDASLVKRRDELMASCARFIDFDRIDVVPMTEYLLLAPPGG
ncbi:MAG: hypothetical protein P8Y92_03100 [Halioglobus sp.]